MDSALHRTTRPRDPRIWQIATLAGLLLWGVLGLEFPVRAAQIAVTLGAALLAQWICTKLWRQPGFEPKSALISGLSLCLLLRTPHLWIVAVVAGIAIASKFALRVRGKHVFNPTNLALIAVLASGAPAWVSPGQWGQAAWFAFAIASAGALVVNRAARSDVTLAFLAAWMGVLFGRAQWLGQLPATPLHMLQNGGLLLFAFFMISDPRTTPDSRVGRIVFAILVALGAGFVQFVLYRQNGLLWSLACCSPVVPLLDRLLPGGRYEWSRPRPGQPEKGSTDETPAHPAGARGLHGAVATARP